MKWPNRNMLPIEACFLQSLHAIKRENKIFSKRAQGSREFRKTYF